MQGLNEIARCERIRVIASLRTDGQLSHLEAALLDAHTRRCESCSRFAAELAAITAVVRTAPLQIPDREVVITGGTAHARSRRVVLHAQAFAALALVVAVALSGSSVDQVGDALRSPEVPEPSVSAAETTDAEMRMIRLLSRRPGGVPGLHKTA
jgi:predicted anti-sigma-YlaC factor YlaD